VLSVKSLCFGFLVATVLCSLPPTNAKEDAEIKTSELMEQVLTAISSSSKGSDTASLEKLCEMVNAVEASVLQMQTEETAEFDFGMARLRAELVVAKSNLTTVIAQHNTTSLELRKHLHNTQLYPRHLADARERSEALERQRELLRRECESDLGGQRLRVDAVKADISTLELALQHLDALAQALPRAESDEIALLETETVAPESDCISLPDQTAPLIRCENGYVVKIHDINGTLTTASPGNGMNYHNHLKCVFRISPDLAGPLDRIELTIHALDTTADVDYVRVYDGPDANPANLLLSVSGSPATPPAPIRSRVSNEMLVSFIMSQAATSASQGLLASFRVVQVPRVHNTAINMCPHSNGDTLILTGDAGFIAEDTRPEFASGLQNAAGSAYSAPVTCGWLIQAVPEQTIQLHFTYLHTRKDVDNVVIYDGSFDKAPQIIKLSGDGTPADIVSTGSALFITYSSDYTVERSGFHLSWCVSGASCPASPTPEPLPTALPVVVPPAPRFNESAPIVQAPEPAAEETPSEIVAPVQPSTAEAPVSPPDYPAPVASKQTINCCPSECNNQGVCNPTTCKCACYASYSGADCSKSDSGAASFALNSLLDLGSGIGSEQGMEALATHQVEDECGDDTNELESAQEVRPLNLDPIRGLLDRLKFELFRSLTYERDTTNMTKIQCNEDLRNQDRDLQHLQQEVLNLTRLVTEAESKQKELSEKEQALKLQVDTTQEYVDELTQRISIRQKARDGRVVSQAQEVKTLQSMRDIISNLGSYECTAKGGKILPASFNKTNGVECFGEVLPIQLTTTDASDCEPLCGLGCVAFSWNTVEGCRFYSQVNRHSSSCSSGPAVSCACFEKSS